MRTKLRIALGVLLIAAAAVAQATPVAAATTFVVNKIGDAADMNLANTKCDTSANSGNQCTLRAAIQEANDTPGVDTINFNISSASKTITPTTPLPPITQPATINGYSQPGASANTKAVGSNAVLKVVLDGINAGNDAVGLSIEGSDVTVRGLVIQRFDGQGIHLSGGDHLIAGNFIGTNAAGTVARGNVIGIQVTGIQNVIGGTTPAARNLVSGNTAYGVDIRGSETTGTLVQGNYIGTDKVGAARLGNGSNGIVSVDAAANTIGGTSAGARNVISGNEENGIHFYGAVTGQVVAGNYVGTNAAGTAALGNDYYGIAIEDAINPIIGGNVAGAGNLVSGNAFDGVELVHVDGATVQGNKIGTKADGTGDLGNGRDGVFILAGDVVVGGSGSAGNLISGNGWNGVWIQYSSYTGNQVLGNAVRANDLNGLKVMSDDTLVRGNAILANGGDGVFVHSNAQGVRISANQIIGNTELGIDLAGGSENAAGVTSNDAKDPDSGANLLQNFPILTSAVRGSNGLTIVQGSINSNPSTTITIDLYLAVNDPSGHGEAQAMLSTQDVTTNATTGSKGFTFALGGLAAGTVLTATATSTTAGNTSEFSANITVVPGP
jgi:CSLREA domain-containing protein